MIALRSLSWVLTQTRDHKRSVGGLVAFSLLIALAEWVEPQMLERFVNAAAVGEYDYVAIAAYVVLILITSLPVLYRWRQWLVGVTAFEIEQRLMLHLTQLDQVYFDRQNPKELMKHLVKGVRGTIRLFLAYFATSFLIQVPLSIMAALFIARFSLTVVALIVGFMCVYLMIGMWLGKRTAVLEKTENELDTVIEARREEMAENMPFLQQQRATDVFYRESRQRDEEQLKQYNGITWLNTLFIGLSGLVQVFAGLLLVFFFLPQVVQGDMPIGTFFALYIYMNYMVQPALSWGDIYAQIKSAWSETEPLADYFTERPVVVDMEGAVSLSPLRDAITFSSVSFAYPGKESQPVLYDVSVTIPKGKMTAIVGQSGGGKSTFAKLLLRSYDPTMGEIDFDGQPLATATLASIHERVAYMPQRPPMFTGSIRSNVDLMRTHNDDEILDALRDMQAEFVSGVTDLDRTADQLSGGEQQRLALARMLLSGADVVVLDEATAALDQATERGVVEVFDQLCRSRGLTQVVIAHRLSTVQHADQIVVMQKGRVAAVGTHDELLAISLVYQDLMKTFARQE